MEFLPAAWKAFGWGIVTSTNPCPMATNIAAVSFIGRKVGSPRQVLFGGLLYALGRSLVYVVLAVVLVGTIHASPLSDFLQTRMPQILGPVLIVVALFLLEMIRFNFSGPGVSENLQKRIEAWGIWGALLMGILFALSFCPASAGYFFVILFWLVAVHESSVVLPALYGLGTALPVVAFALLIAFSARSVGKAFNVVTRIERWARGITGVIFLVLGIYFSLVHCFGMTWL